MVGELNIKHDLRPYFLTGVNCTCACLNFFTDIGFDCLVSPRSMTLDWRGLIFNKSGGKLELLEDLGTGIPVP